MRNRIAARLRLPRDKNLLSKRPRNRIVRPNISSATRSPHATLQIAFLPWRDVQIDPKAIRADFEFLISTKLRWIWLKENFRDVAIPKLVAAATGIGIRKNRDNSKPNVEP